MFDQEKLIESARRVLSIPSDEESGNEELALYFHDLMKDLGFKTMLKTVQHSQSTLSKRQVNVIGFSSDTLIDRSTKKGLALINPIDVTLGHLPHLWSETQGSPYTPTIKDRKIFGIGANQGKVDFLCRIFAGSELLEQRHKIPLYLVGVSAFHSGLLGSKYTLESLMVNPKQVVSYAPTDLKWAKSTSGQVSYEIELETPSYEKDSRGYNRKIFLRVYGQSADLPDESKAINSFDLIFDLLMDAAANGYDFQWSNLEVLSPEGSIPDLAQVQLYLSAFQFEDFKQFIRNKIESVKGSRFFRVEYQGVVEHSVGFLPVSTIEIIIELSFKLKEITNHLKDQSRVYCGFTKIQQMSVGRTKLRMDIRYSSDFDIQKFEITWKKSAQDIFDKFNRSNFNLTKIRNIPCFFDSEGQQELDYVSDAGLYTKLKTPTKVIGLGSVDQAMKAPNEFVYISQLDEAVRFYKEYILKNCLL